MPENEFEKKVQADMQGFKIKPSDEVWPKVEERIRKKKKRRGLMIIFLLAGLVLLGYWQRHFFSGNKNDVIAESERANQNSTVQPGIDSVKTGSSEIIKPENQNPASGIPAAEQQANTAVKNEPAEGVQTKNKVEESNKVTVKPKTQGRKQIRANTVAEKSEKKKEITEISEPPAEKTQEPGISSDTAAGLSAGNENNKTVMEKQEVQTDSARVKSEKLQIEETAEKKDQANDIKADLTNNKTTDTIVSAKTKKPSAKKWKWGVQFTPGVSYLADHIVSLSMNKSADYAGSPIPGSGSGSATPPAPPSESSAGFAFQLGGFAQKEISRRSILSLGLQYGYYSDRIRVGGRRDSLRANSSSAGLQNADYIYGAANSSGRFTNKYHFIEIPLTYHWQANRNSEKPFYLNVGIRLSQLISSNALVYDTAFGGIYYNNKKLFSKTQFGLSAGFAWSFYTKRKMKWSIGPLINIHFTQMLDNPADRNKYLLFTGIRAAVVFPRKK